MAMTAWSAKVLRSSICLSLNGLYIGAANDKRANGLVLPHQRRGEQSSGSPSRRDSMA